MQRNVGSAIAYNVWQYFQVAPDIEFLEFYGAELILEIARFWSGDARFNERRGPYEMHGVRGPNEFHEAYPDAPAPGLANNAYTIDGDVGAAAGARRARVLTAMRRAELNASLESTRDEIARRDDINRRMFVPIRDDCVISSSKGMNHCATSIGCSRVQTARIHLGAMAGAADLVERVSTGI